MDREPTTTIMRPDDVRKRNRQRVLSAVRRSGNLSRTEIGRITGLSAATISAITSNFIAEGVLIQPSTTEPINAGRGRPKVSLAVNPGAALVGTVVLQFNSVSAAIIDYAGRTVAENAIEIDTSTARPADIRDSLQSCLAIAMERSPGVLKTVRRIAVGVQGVTDIKGTTMLWSPISEHRDLPIKAWLEAGFGTPTRISNDCDMIARALHWRDPERYGENFAAVLLAHGVGMGLFLRGEIVNGTRSSGTEFGHMTYIPDGALCRCGNRGCIEAYASGYAINRKATGLTGGTPPPGLPQSPDIQSTIAAARSGDEAANAAIEAAGAAIGTGLANLYALIDPFPIILVGSGSAAFDLMELSIRKPLNGSIAGHRARNTAIDCFVDEQPLVREGCAISALMEHDSQVAVWQNLGEAVT